MTGLSIATQRVLRAAGWSPGRRIDTTAWRVSFVDTGLAMPAAAAEFLGEFGGLTFDLSALGADRVWTSAEIDPMVAWGCAEDRFVQCGDRLGRCLFPVGELNRGQALLGMDETAELYLVKDAAASFGQLPVALDNLVADSLPTPII